jgi:ATP-binding cassette subfamily B protein
MVWRTLQGFATLGDLVLLYQTFTRGQAIMRSLLSNLGQVLTSNLFIANLFDFLNLPKRIVDPVDPRPAPAPLRHGITFRSVTFRYPHSESAVLEDFDFFIPAGQIVAIVGPNGAGKTTLFKLLCRFYDVDAGAIQLDGVDLREIAVDDLRRQITTLLQSPVPYQLTAAENIAFGDVQTSPTREQIEAAARQAGAHEVIERLPQGYDTLLGKWFVNGVDLSGGEQQRIALARAYLRQAPIMLLDEPTSFIDSWAEAEWFDRFRELASGRTGILITHRFTIAMRADSICVMDGGKIVEAVSHSELVRRGGLYARSWDAQMRASLDGAGEHAVALASGVREDVF